MDGVLAFVCWSMCSGKSSNIDTETELIVLDELMNISEDRTTLTCSGSLLFVVLNKFHNTEERRTSESRMRENLTSGLMQGGLE